MSGFLLVNAEPVDETVLTDSNIDIDDDAALWASGTSYDTGEEVYKGINWYRSLIDSNLGNDPELDVDGTQWNNLGRVNRFRAFDDIINNPSTQADTVEFELTPATSVDTVGVLNLDADTVQLIATSASAGGEVFNESMLLKSSLGTPSWKNFFFGQKVRRADVVFTDIPVHADIVLDVIATKTGGTAAIGEVVMGYAARLGATRWGADLGIHDYSVKGENAFGKTIVVERSFAKRANFTIWVDTPVVASVQRALTAVRARPALYIGNQDREETIVYGYFRRFNIIEESALFSVCSIQVRGLT